MRYAINIILCMFTYGINMIVSFIVTTVLVNTLGNETYSFYPIANNISYWITIVSMTINAMASRFISVSVHSGDLNRANKYYSSLVIINTFVSTMFLPIICVCIVNAHNIINIPKEISNDVKWLFLFVSLSALISMMSNVFATAENVRNKLEMIYIARFVQSLARLIMAVLVFVFFRPCLAGVGFSLFIGDVAYFILIFFFKRKLMPEIHFVKTDFDFKIAKELIVSNIWCALNSLGNSLLMQVDVILCNLYLSISASGWLSIAATLPNTIISITTALISVFIPKLYKEYADKNSTTVNSIIFQAQKTTGFVSSGICALVIVYGRAFLALWVPEINIDVTYRIMILYTIPIFVIGMFKPLYNALIMANKLAFYSVINVLSGVLNVLFTIILIKKTGIGVYAAVLTTFIINIVWYSLILPIFTAKVLNIKKLLLYKEPIKTVLLCILWLVFLSMFSKLFCLYTWPNLIIAILLSCIIYVAICGSIVYIKVIKDVFAQKKIKKY